MDKVLARKIELDKVTIDVENKKRHIRNIETAINMKQKEIQDAEDSIKKMESRRKNLIGILKPVKVISEPKKKTTYPRRAKKVREV